MSAPSAWDEWTMKAEVKIYHFSAQYAGEEDAPNAGVPAIVVFTLAAWCILRYSSLVWCIPSFVRLDYGFQSMARGGKAMFCWRPGKAINNGVSEESAKLVFTFVAYTQAFGRTTHTHKGTHVRTAASHRNACRSSERSDRQVITTTTLWQSVEKKRKMVARRGGRSRHKIDYNEYVEFTMHTHTHAHTNTYALMYKLPACTQHLSCLFKHWLQYILIQLVFALWVRLNL